MAAAEEAVSWVAFTDPDEYLVLHQHDSLQEFLQDHCSSGAVAIHWKMMGTGGARSYLPLPMVLRGQYAGDDKRNAHVKSIVHLPDMDLDRGPHAHYPYLKAGTVHNTAGLPVTSHESMPIETAVAELYHYAYRSQEEYLGKRTKGRVSHARDGVDKALIETAKKGLLPEGDPLPEGHTFDDKAWKAFVKLVPEYKHFEEIQKLWNGE